MRRQGCRLRCGKAVGGARAELQAALRQGCRRRWAAGDAATGLAVGDATPPVSRTASFCSTLRSRLS
eukprot:3976122-Prymnesium_polylepis.1